ncbi:MAG TPA: aldose 1-epimerase family protein [Steroidobacteraceae bacterium]|jgi:galactose mutarotase-like enzyme|nr:aldose 1-epimerase family protein [Steroidobacteraceae bacterium]
MPDQAPVWLSITSGDMTAEINPQGAQLSSLQDRCAADLLWNGDPKVWAGRAPLLFPIVGVLAGGVYRLGSHNYALSRHGFARDKRFSVEAHGVSTASFRLDADDATLRVYPFRFELNVRYELRGATLSVTTHVRNRGDVDMPASFGYHPGFRWPLAMGQPRESHFVQFESDEPAAVRRIDAAGLLTPVRHPTPIVDRRLKLTDALFQQDVLIFDQLKSRSVTYGSSGPRLRIDFPDAAYLGIWTKPGAPFICVEPWHGITDPQDFSGDFFQKPGVFALLPGATLAARMDITWLAS